MDDGWPTGVAVGSDLGRVGRLGRGGRLGLGRLWATQSAYWTLSGGAGMRWDGYEWRSYSKSSVQVAGSMEGGMAWNRD